ncbi:MAG TPA: hypothetical protein VF530_14640 [Planctomycetota bacterium]
MHSLSTLPIRAGVFESEPDADRAVVALLAAGFSKDRISVVSARPVPHHAEHADVLAVAPSGAHTRSAVALGGTIGSVLGGAAVVAGVLVTGGMGLMVVGPLLVGATAGGLGGGFVGAMMTRGFEPAIAEFYDQALSRSQYLVAVEDDAGGPHLASAEAVFELTGATPIPLRKG